MVSTVDRSLMRELPDQPEGKYLWKDMIHLAGSVFFVIWMVYQHEWWIDAFILGFVIPDLLCAKFEGRQKSQKSVQSIMAMNKPLKIFCWILAFVVITLAILAGLGVKPFGVILSPWPEHVFPSIPDWLMAPVFVVFIPVLRVALFIEKRAWLCWVWASAASAIALAILYF